MLRALNKQILTINGGSSSIKFALFTADESLHQILQGKIERIGLPDSTFVVKGENQDDNFSSKHLMPDYARLACTGK